jgi:PAS domain S-box-containing protein
MTARSITPAAAGNVQGVRIYWVILPSIVIGAALLAEGLVEDFFDIHGIPHQLAHVLLIAMIAAVAAVFSHILFRAVRNHQHALEAANGELEARVRERTAELTVAGEALRAEVVERRRSEEMLRKLSRAVEQTADAVCIIDRDGRIEYVNPAFERLSGYSREEAAGKTPAMLEPGGAQAGERPWEAVPTGQIVRGPKQRKDGGLWHSAMTAAPIRDAAGAVTHFVCAYRDISERVEAQARLSASEAQLRAFAAHIQTVREDERAVIAREIHDELGQALTGLRFDLVRLAGKPDLDPATTAVRVRDMLKLVDDAIRSVRRISTELRPGLLDDLGLGAAIEWQAQEFQARTGISCDLQLTGKDLVLDQHLCTALFRIVQEALTNVARHAAATRVLVSLREEAERLELEVRDDGRGITEGEAADRRSLGLLGMRERAALFGGTVSVLGEPGRGTTVRVEVPLRPGSPSRREAGAANDPTAGGTRA